MIFLIVSCQKSFGGCVYKYIIAGHGRDFKEIYCENRFDWFFAKEEDDDVLLLQKLEIPTNRLVRLGKTQELSSLMHIMSFEHYSADIYREEVEQKYLEILLYKLSRMTPTEYRKRL